MTEQEVRECIRLYQLNKDERAFNKLYAHFHNMMHSITNKYGSFDKNEIASEANFRMVEAIERFNLERPTLFATYLYGYVNNYIKNYLRRYEPLFGNRSGIGTKMDQLFVDNSLGENIPSKHDLSGVLEDEVVGEALKLCAAEVLESDELEVIERYFGLGSFAEPVFNEVTGVNEVSEKFNYKLNIMVSRSPASSKKISRVAKAMNQNRATVVNMLGKALDKLKNSPKFKNLCTVSLTNTSTQFMEML